MVACRAKVIIDEETPATMVNATQTARTPPQQTAWRYGPQGASKVATASTGRRRYPPAAGRSGRHGGADPPATGPSSADRLQPRRSADPVPAPGRRAGHRPAAGRDPSRRRPSDTAPAPAATVRCRRAGDTCAGYRRRTPRRARRRARRPRTRPGPRAPPWRAPSPHRPAVTRRRDLAARAAAGARAVHQQGHPQVEECSHRGSQHGDNRRARTGPAGWPPRSRRTCRESPLVNGTPACASRKISMATARSGCRRDRPRMAPRSLRASPGP